MKKFCYWMIFVGIGLFCIEMGMVLASDYDGGDTLSLAMFGFLCLILVQIRDSVRELGERVVRASRPAAQAE